MEKEASIAVIIGIGGFTLLFLTMLVGIVTSRSKRKILEKENKFQAIEKQRQIDLFKAIAEAEEAQKSKIASNLHDEIIPILALTARNMSYHISELEKKGINLDELKNDTEAFSELSNRIREIAHDLIPSLFTSFGLLKSIEAFIKQMNRSADSAAEFENETTFSGELSFSKNEQLIIFRICLEILNNLFKHAQYQYLKVTLEDISDNFTLVFAHDGKGITDREISVLKESSIGMGLKNMEIKALLLNASIEYSVELGVSFVKLIIPIEK